jgi:hypothetical protein
MIALQLLCLLLLMMCGVVDSCFNIVVGGGGGDDDGGTHHEIVYEFSAQLSVRQLNESGASVHELQRIDMTSQIGITSTNDHQSGASRVVALRYIDDDVRSDVWAAVFRVDCASGNVALLAAHEAPSSHLDHDPGNLHHIRTIHYSINFGCQSPYCFCFETDLFDNRKN